MEVEPIYFIVRYTPACYNKFVEHIHQEFQNVEDPDRILDFMQEQSNTENMDTEGVIVGIEDNEIAMEEGGSIDRLVNPDTQQYVRFIEECNQGGGRRSRRNTLRKKTRGKKRKSRRKLSTKRGKKTRRHRGRKSRK